MPDICRPFALQWRGPRQGWVGRQVSREENQMHPEDLIKPDLVSEIVLVSTGAVIFVSFALIIAVALTRA